MKKIILSLTAFAFLFIACSEDSSSPQDDQLNIDMSDFYLYTDADVNQSGRSVIGIGDDTQKSCYTMANLNRLLNQDPELEQKMYDIEYNTCLLYTSDAADD